LRFWISTLPRYSNTQNDLTRNIRNQDKFTHSVIYKLTCPDCGKAYIGKTGRDFKTRFNEHKRSFQYNNHALKYGQHLTEYMHSFGNMHNILQIIQFQKKKLFILTQQNDSIFTNKQPQTFILMITTQYPPTEFLILFFNTSKTETNNIPSTLPLTDQYRCHITSTHTWYSTRHRRVYSTVEISNTITKHSDTANSIL